MASKNRDSSRKRKADALSFKEGQPGDRELDEFALNIGALKWEKLGLQLGISQNVLDTIKASAEDKPHEMLLRWRSTTTSTTPYRDLYYALCHERVGLDNVARKFCLVEMSPKAIKAPKTDSKKQKTQAKVSKPAKKGARRTPAREAKDKKKAEAVLKEGVPKHAELESLGEDIEKGWMSLGRQLEVEEPKLQGIDRDADSLAEKGFQMLKHWKQKNGSDASYKVLSDALKAKKRQDLAETYCYEQQ